MESVKLAVLVQKVLESMAKDTAEVSIQASVGVSQNGQGKRTVDRVYEYVPTPEEKAIRLPARGPVTYLTVRVGKHTYEIPSEALLRPGSVFYDDNKLYGIKHWSFPEKCPVAFEEIISLLVGKKTITQIKESLSIGDQKALRDYLLMYGFYEFLGTKLSEKESVLHCSEVHASSRQGRVSPSGLISNTDWTDYWETSSNDTLKPSILVKFRQDSKPTQITIGMRAESQLNIFSCRVFAKGAILEEPDESVPIPTLTEAGGVSFCPSAWTEIGEGATEETSSPNNRKTLTIKLLPIKPCREVALFFENKSGPVNLKFYSLELHGYTSEVL